MDEFQKSILAALESHLELTKAAGERLDKIVEHWNRSEERALAHHEVEARHLFLREKEHAQAFSGAVRAAAIDLINESTQTDAWTLDYEARKRLRKSLDELDAAEGARQKRRSSKPAVSPLSSNPEDSTVTGKTAES